MFVLFAYQSDCLFVCLLLWLLLVVGVVVGGVVARLGSLPSCGASDGYSQLRFRTELEEMARPACFIPGSSLLIVASQPVLLLFRRASSPLFVCQLVLRFPLLKM